MLGARWLYLDADEDGDRVLKRVDTDAAAGRIPPLTAVVNTSPGRYQVLWRIEPSATDIADRHLRTLARRYGTDRAATDGNRVLRLPGFRSRKRDCEVRLIRHSPGPQPGCRTSPTSRNPRGLSSTRAATGSPGTDRTASGQGQS